MTAFCQGLAKKTCLFTHLTKGGPLAEIDKNHDEKIVSVCDLLAA